MYNEISGKGTPPHKRYTEYFFKNILRGGRLDEPPSEVRTSQRRLNKVVKRYLDSEQCRNYAVCRAAMEKRGRRRRERERFVRRRRKKIAASRKGEKEREIRRGRRIVNRHEGSRHETNEYRKGRPWLSRREGRKVRGRRR